MSKRVNKVWEQVLIFLLEEEKGASKLCTIGTQQFFSG